MGKEIKLKCPVCTAINDSNAKRCNQCGEWLLDQYTPPSIVTSESNSSEHKGKRFLGSVGWFYWLSFLFLLLMWIADAMTSLTDLAICLGLVCTSALVVGIIHPSSVIKWGQNRNRGKVIKTFVPCTLLLFFFIGFAGQPAEVSNPEVMLSNSDS